MACKTKSKILRSWSSRPVVSHGHMPPVIARSPAEASGTGPLRLRPLPLPLAVPFLPCWMFPSWACFPVAHSTSNWRIKSSVMAAHLSLCWATCCHPSPATLATFRSSSSCVLYWCGCLARTRSGSCCSARHHSRFLQDRISRVGPGCRATWPRSCHLTLRMNELHLPPQAWFL